MDFYTVTVFENTKDNSFSLMLNSAGECVLNINETQARHVIECCKLKKIGEENGVIEWFDDDKHLFNFRNTPNS